MAARERDGSARAAWWNETVSQPVGDRVFLDETGTNTALAGHSARAERGERATAGVPRNPGPHTTVVGCLPLAGIGPAMLVEGAATTEVFEPDVEQVLVPWLRPGQIVILDNRAIHTGVRARTLLEAAGYQMRFLPPASPDVTPIAWAFSALTAWLRRAAARTPPTLEHALAEALNHITAGDACGWFIDCGYVPLRRPV